MASLSSLGQFTTGYIKWLTIHEEDRLKWRRAVADPAAAVARETAPPAPSLPPERSMADWARFIGARLARVVAFEEVDLFFWVGLFLILDQLVVLVWLLAISQAVQAIAATIWRALQHARFDRGRRS